jgi:hypothetical protein
MGDIKGRIRCIAIVTVARKLMAIVQAATSQSIALAIHAPSVESN